jgi:transketolase
VTLAAAGVTVHEALAAAGLLAEEGISARHRHVLGEAAGHGRIAGRGTADGPIVTAEDHYPEGGLGDAVLAAAAVGGGVLSAVSKLAVRSMPGPAAPAGRPQLAGIGMAPTATAAAELMAGRGP